MTELETSPARPSLVTQACAPDVLPRLRNIAKLYDGNAYVVDAVADAINAISGLRDSDARRLAMINEAKAERDEARARVAELEAALELAEGRLTLLMRASLAESDHPTATGYVLEKVRAALPPAAPPAPQPTSAARETR